MAASQISSDLSRMSMPGTTANPQNPGKGTAGSGVRVGPGAPRGAPGAPAVAAAVLPPGMEPPGPAGAPGGAPRAPRAPQPLQPQQPRFSASNPMMGTAPLPSPRPGLQPPYPDARSPNPTLMPNGMPIMPPPPGFPLAGMIPRVPLSTAPGARPAMAPPSHPPTMPPVAQANMPTMANSMQMPHVPPGGAPMPMRPGQTPQAMRRPGMSSMLPPVPPPGAQPPPPPMGRPAGGITRPVPGGPPVRAPDGNMYVHAPHPGGLYQRVR
jgi:formin 2